LRWIATIRPPRNRQSENGEEERKRQADEIAHLRIVDSQVTLDGRYTVRFEQIAPEDPTLDFANQTAFVAVLDRKAQQEGGGTIRLFRDAARNGGKVITAKGRYYVDVSFGDFPYAIRFTPADAG